MTVKFYRVRSSLPAKFHLDRFNVRPLRGEKPKTNQLLSKNNTGSAALRAVLPVTITTTTKKTTTVKH